MSDLTIEDRVGLALLESADDDDASQRLDTLFQTYPTKLAEMYGALRCVAAYYEDTASEGLSAWIANAWASDPMGALYAALAGNLEGIEAANATGDRFAIFLRDASHPGKVRFQEFGVNGFFAHQTCENWEQALKIAAQSGYVMPVQGVLARLSGSPRFLAGMRLAEGLQDDREMRKAG